MFYRRWSNYIPDADAAALQDKAAPTTLVAGATDSAYQPNEQSACIIKTYITQKKWSRCGMQEEQTKIQFQTRGKRLF